MRPWMVIMLLLTAVLAGCSESPESVGEDADDEDDSDHEHGDHEHGDHDDGSGEHNNTPPVAVLTAEAVNGTAPLLVNLTLNGSDADGDNLTWTLQLNGTDVATGDVLPAQHQLNLTAGNHTALLVVSDGEAQGTSSLAFNVSAVVAGPSVEPLFVVREMVEGCYLCIDSELATGEPMGAPGCAGWNLEENELDCGWVEIPAEYQGLPYSVFSFTSGTLPLVGSDGHPDVEFYDACSPDGTLIEQHFDQSTDTVVGVIPAGAGCIVGFEFHWPNIGHTIEFSLGAVAHE